MDSFFKQPTMFPGFGGSTRNVITPLTEEQAREAAASMPPLRVRPRDNSTGNFATKIQTDPRTGARSIVDDPTKPIFVNGPGEGRTVGSSTRSLNNVGGGTNVPNTSAPGARFQFGMGRPDDGRRIDASVPHGSDNFGRQFDYNPYQAASDAYAKSERSRPLDPNDPFDPRNAPKMHQNEMPFGGFRAEGGPVVPDQAYVVGERGPELMVPQVPSVIIPAEQMPFGQPQPVVKDWSQFTPPPPSMPVHDQTAPQMMTGQVPEVNYADPMPPAPATTEDIRFNGLAARARLDNAKYDEMMFGRPASDFPSTATTGATPPARNATIFDLRPQPATKQPFLSPSEKDALKRQANSLPDFVEQSMRGMTGSQKKAARAQFGIQLGAQQFQEQLSLDKQAKAAVGAWEAAKATRESLGLPPISDEMDAQFWNGNVQKQLAMVQQMGLLTDEHLRQKHGTEQQQQRQNETADERAYRESLTKEERAYLESRDAQKMQEQQRLAQAWQPIPNSGLQMNGLGHVVSTSGKGFSMEDAQKQGLEIDSIDSDGKVRWKRPESRTPTTKDLYNGTDFTPKTLQYNPETGQWEPPKIAQPEAATGTAPPQPARTHNAPPAASQPTAQHVALLKAHPDKAAEFDAKFGPGTAAKILGKK